MSPVASTRHSPEHMLLSICSEKFPDIPRCSLPAPDTPGHFLHPPAVFHLRLPLDSPPLKIACNDLPRYHPPAEVFCPSPFKWFFSCFHPSSRTDSISCLQCLTGGQSSPFKGRVTSHSCQKGTPVSLQLAWHCLGIRPVSAFLPEECSCFVVWRPREQLWGTGLESGLKSWFKRLAASSGTLPVAPVLWTGLFCLQGKQQDWPDWVGKNIGGPQPRSLPCKWG